MNKSQNLRYLKEAENTDRYKFPSLIKILISNYKIDNDPLHFFRIYELNLSYIYDFVFSLTGSESQTVYIVQKTFQRLRNDLHHYNFESDFNDWLKDLAIHELWAAECQLSIHPNKLNHAG